MEVATNKCRYIPWKLFKLVYRICIRWMLLSVYSLNLKCSVRATFTCYLIPQAPHSWRSLFFWSTLGRWPLRNLCFPHLCAHHPLQPRHHRRTMSQCSFIHWSLLGRDIFVKRPVCWQSDLLFRERWSDSVLNWHTYCTVCVSIHS